MQPLEADDPRTVGEYRLLRRLGAGGMGRVYLGRSPGGRTVAVKVVHPHFAADEEFRGRFRREVDSARRVGGEWTAPVLDADPEAPTPWVATGYVAGPSLHQAVVGHGPLPEHTVRALGAGLGEALAAVHARGLVHRDVKPSNVLLTLDGPRLIDFGIARAMDGTASLTSTGVTVGSPGYMSPEQVLGREAGPASDVFSLGAVLAYAATGTPPFPGDNSAALLYKVVHEEPELGDLDGVLRETVTACLAKDATARPSPAEVARRLAGAAGATGLVRPGWLPGPVVEGVSRRAVELLELEADDEPPAPPPVPSAPAPSPPVHATPTEPSAPPPGGPPGAFGPPPPYGAPTEDGTPPRRRRRRAALLAAGALLAATAAGGLLLFPDGLFPGGGGDDPKPDDRPPGTVPEAFVGTWEGQTVTRSGLHGSTLTLTVSEGREGEETVRMVYEITGLECRARGTVEDVSKTRLKVTERSEGDSPEVLGVKVCSGETATVVLTLDGEGRLHYASDDVGAGRPEGDLTRRK
ncbi:serine/threonine-protein kinase [Streptomyces macrosporus]|uniref:Protein kinase domain-containing protein n=1 Tax=Streptomyces macrosporus TaxID=44032 RepID=A0ABN3J4R6_9ACTN